MGAFFARFRRFTVSRAVVGATFALALAGATLEIRAESTSDQGPRVEIVVGSRADRLERFAAEELARIVRSLFGAKAEITESPSDQVRNLILVGNPTSNPALEKGAWPRISEQGQVIRSMYLAEEKEGKPRLALVVGGGSPVATLWAVYEWGRRLGIRYLVSGDVLPAKRPEFRLDGYDLALEPKLKLRAWRTINDFCIGPESWGLADQKKLLGQLAKLKFNRLLLAVYPWQPYVHYEYRGVKKSTALNWYGFRFPVTGEIPGRVAFHGAEEFVNPDFADAKTYEERIAAGVGLARGLMSAAKELGMSTALALSPLEFSREFASVLSDSKTYVSLADLSIGPGAKLSPTDPTLLELAKKQIRAYLDTYPDLDVLYLSSPEFPEWNEHYRESWRRLGVGNEADLERLLNEGAERDLVAHGERGRAAVAGNIVGFDFLRALLADENLLRRPGKPPAQVVVMQVDPALFASLPGILPAGVQGVAHLVDYTAPRVAKHADLLAQATSEKLESSLVLTLADDNVGILPQSVTSSIHALTDELGKLGWAGYSTRYWIAGDLDADLDFLARAAFEPGMTPEISREEFIQAMCGPGVGQRVSLALAEIEKATNLIDRNDLGFAFPVQGMFMKHYTAAPVPAWWSEVGAAYAVAMDEMYRSHDRSLAPGRPFLRRWAKRLEFAVEYMGAVEALRRAGAAKAKGDREEQISQLEKAVEGLYNGVNALGEVARDPSDRGVIAVCAEFAYRPLLREFEAVSGEEEP